MKLSEVKFQNIKIGMEIMSAIGISGKVTECIAEILGSENGVR